jgi:hypothetical protein
MTIHTPVNPELATNIIKALLDLCFFAKKKLQGEIFKARFFSGFP